MTDTSDNPYQNRDHENTSTNKTLSDVKAVAALLGSVSGQLKDIDQKQISGNEFTKANKMNAQQALKAFARGTPDAEVPLRATAVPTEPEQVISAPLPEQIPLPEKANIPKEVTQQLQPSAEIEERLSRLERQMSIYKKTFKFKRGVSYNVSTASIKGTFKDPDDIVDIVLSELAKSSKSITIKLNDTTKNKQ